MNKRGGTYRLNENAKENGFIPGMSGMSTVNSMPVNAVHFMLSKFGHLATSFIGRILV